MINRTINFYLKGLNENASIFSLNIIGYGISNNYTAAMLKRKTGISGGTIDKIIIEGYIPITGRIIRSLEKTFNCTYEDLNNKLLYINYIDDLINNQNIKNDNKYNAFINKYNLLKNKEEYNENIDINNIDKIIPGFNQLSDHDKELISEIVLSIINK